MKRGLFVNLDHIATVRQARKTQYPALHAAIHTCEIAGASGITLHLREDRRHIQDADLRLAKEVSHLPIALEMANTAEMVGIAKKIHPFKVTLVPEKREELTTEGGLDARKFSKEIEKSTKELHDAGIRVCLFLEPEKTQIEVAKNLGCDEVEIHTGKYANFGEDFHFPEMNQEALRIIEAANYGVENGLIMNAGHGLHYENIRALAVCQSLTEFSIGHAIISRALFTGLEKAVKDMVGLLWNS